MQGLSWVRLELMRTLKKSPQRVPYPFYLTPCESLWTPLKG